MENLQRVADLLKEHQLDWVLLTGADSVCFATGHAVPIEIGQSPFTGGPTAVLVSAEAAAGVAAANVEGQQAPDLPYEIYEGFACSVTDQTGNYLTAVRKLATTLGVGGNIGFERASCPRLLNEVIGDGATAFDTPLAKLRAVKTKTEIDKLRRAAEVAAIGQTICRQESTVGRGELVVMNLIRSAMEMAAGERCPLAGEYVASVERNSALGTPPGSYVIQDGDPIICDLAPRVAGYWGDSCNAFVVGTAPTDEYRKMFNAAKSTLEHAIAELKPGLRVCDFDGKLRTHMEALGFSYPHHSGHGIGTSVHEYPRLLPDETAMIEEDMILMVEPGAYVPGIGGLRTEFMLRVTATGCEVMAPFVIDLDMSK